MSIQYRSEIDGLRALAVMPVIFFHASKILCNENKFYDYMHPKNSCMTKITNQIN